MSACALKAVLSVLVYTKFVLSVIGMFVRVIENF